MTTALLVLAPAVTYNTAHAASSNLSSASAQSLIISYRSTPAGRPALLRALRTQLAPRLHILQATDRLAHYRILFGRLVDANTWDALLILDFDNTAQVAAWRTIETGMPAGLDIADQTAITTIESTISDSIGNAGPIHGGSDPVYMVIPYDYFVPTADYANYARSYVFPQTDGWISNGALNAYQLYVARYTAGRNWMSLLVLAYYGDDGLNRRNAVIAATRRTLNADPDWTEKSIGKGHIRTEKAAMIADLIAAD
ncbi:hypothetical protein [Komagataeibacter xylinus]|uniref:hypothetical protein n=1 Tax=Komagataeibacter xylinus TaxID=28448 RepID=UPI001013D69C|nr:hypothetical protein [Komagataeibacter xylinus]